MLSETSTGSFEEFLGSAERRLRHALTAAFGPETGREATAEALAYGWEHWDRIAVMDNPAGYLYTVGRNVARRSRRSRRSRRPVLPAPPDGHDPWIEPGLPAALAGLSEQQRTVVALLHGFEWTMSEVAELLGLSKSTVQNHAERGMRKLQRALGVEA